MEGGGKIVVFINLIWWEDGGIVPLFHSINGRCYLMSPLAFTYENMTLFSFLEMTLGPSFSVKDDGGLYMAQTLNGPTLFKLNQTQ